jgi:hypothetical protein
MIQTITPITCLVCYHQDVQHVIIYSALLNNYLRYIFVNLTLIFCIIYHYPL